MAILNVEDFCAGVAEGTRILALDVGSKTIGLASAVVGTDIVMPLKTLVRRKFTLDAGDLAAVIRDYDVAGLVVGWPLLPDGHAGRRCQSVKDFTAELDRYLQNTLPFLENTATHVIPEATTELSGIHPAAIGLLDHGSPLSRGRQCQNKRDIPITFWDERFSTQAGDAVVDDIGRAAGKSVRHRRDEIIDSLAAQQILSDFMEQNILFT